MDLHPELEPMIDDNTQTNKIAWIVLAIIVIGLAFIGYKVWPKTVASKDYKAVFLTNGQVYFGQLNPGSQYSKLTLVYYLQTTGSGTSSSVSLAKLGGELHGPTDEMNIANSQILFYETLRSDSQILKAIAK